MFGRLIECEKQSGYLKYYFIENIQALDILFTEKEPIKCYVAPKNESFNVHTVSDDYRNHPIYVYLHNFISVFEKSKDDEIIVTKSELKHIEETCCVNCADYCPDYKRKCNKNFNKISLVDA